MEYESRKLTPDDYDKLLDLWSKCGLPYRPRGRDSRSNISREIAKSETAFIGMFDNARLIGFVLATSDGRKGWINRLAVDPEYQRRGLGCKLIEEGEKFLNGLGLKVIAALIEGDNKPSFATFKKAGYSHYEDIVYYSKRTSPDD
jgi:ribosomal protein S18 acetylase RimI-like enzyme